MFEHPEPVAPRRTNQMEEREKVEVLPTETQAKIVFDIVLQTIQYRGHMNGDNFSKEIISMAEELVEQSPDFDEEGVSLVSKICRDISPHIQGVELKFFGDIGGGERIEGMWDGQKITISPDLLLEIVHGEDVAYLRAVRAHEDYHEKNRHLDRFKIGETASAGAIVTIGGIGFTETELIEGMNTLDVSMPAGHEAPSYRSYANKILEAIKKSKKVSLNDVRRAINKTKDLRSIEDAPQ